MAAIHAFINGRGCGCYAITLQVLCSFARLSLPNAIESRVLGLSAAADEEGRLKGAEILVYRCRLL